MSNRRATKRRRHQHSYTPYGFHASSAATTSNEERLLHQTIQNSKLGETRGTRGALGNKIEVPWGPVFFPTVEDMEGSPLDYIDKIRPIAQRYGICKIVPPEGWKQRDFFAAKMEVPRKFSTKLQLLHRIQEGISFGDGDEYNPGSYLRYASNFTKHYKRREYPEHDLLTASQTNATAVEGQSQKNESLKSSVPMQDDRRLFIPENLEQDYWDVVENRSREVIVEYGNDVDTTEFGSGFPLSERGRSLQGTLDPNKESLPEPKFGTEDFYKETWWNLNNIPNTPDSVLRHVKVGINGINVPWMYYGSLFTTFCWHNEDNYLYSINYHHHGAPKQWYGVPGTQKDADGLEKVFKSYLSMKMRDVPDLLHHITTQFSPRLLQNANVPIYKLLQHEGEFVVTFPRSFHGGFSMGPNIGEAVNFATHDWIAHGSDANERYRSFARPAVLSHDRLTFTMAHHLSEQKSYKNCKLLLNELERVVTEELQLRRKLLMQGVRDVSDMIQLPPNRLNQLDEDSADYDDKRLCHACKHVCFFSAVACECSQSKVSCLRHSHYMCRCTTERRYLMIWSTEEELENTCRAVRDHCESLKPEGFVDEDEMETKSLDQLPEVAVGVERDLELHKHDVIPTDPYVPSQKDEPLPAAEVTTDEDRDEEREDVIGLDDSDDDKKKDGDYQDGVEGM
ncbi:JmjC domain hydroxylase [Nitzschia inconspicua]|uniref:JmjC domain hydroxylase n=1 Tax=Nitzschia inconspicua TaxID=303405 RepID=A0A9K3KT64_9STRA|nr:JmjC domain hydroxylase [Nitzschia inconspicua]